MQIEEAKKYCKQIKDRDLWKVGYVYGSEAIETVLNELEKKDKVIDEMAKYIKEPYRIIAFGSRKPKIEIIKEYFYKKVSDNK